MTPEELLAEHTPQVRALAGRLREIVRRAVPQAAEVAYPGWHGIGYRHPEVGYFCGIFPGKDSVRLGFEWGALLADPAGDLSGGRQVRYYEVRQPADIRADRIRPLIREALRLGHVRRPPPARRRRAKGTPRSRRV